MKDIIAEIFEDELNEKVEVVTEITGFGSVNHVFDVTCLGGNYVVRVNDEENRNLEFVKENWCLEKTNDLNIPVPKSLKIGTKGKFSYMIQEKLRGINGSKCNDDEKLQIWRNLGKFTSTFNKIRRIEVPEIEAAEFHKGWKSRLSYNISCLNRTDSLVCEKTFDVKEQKQIKTLLLSLVDKDFEIGLVHGDLSPRNVIFNERTTFLLDWGTAEIDVVPHTEIGIVALSGDANEIEFVSFLEGMEIGADKYELIREEVKKLNLLHTLDKYRWADGFGVNNLDEYARKVRITFELVKSV